MTEVATIALVMFITGFLTGGGLVFIVEELVKLLWKH